MISLTIYSLPECHLCEIMQAELLPLLRDRAELRVVDISQDPGLEREYALRIPVLKAGDTELCQYQLDSERVERFLCSQ